MAEVSQEVAEYLGCNVSYVYDDETLQLLSVRVHPGPLSGIVLTVQVRDLARNVVREIVVDDGMPTVADLRGTGLHYVRRGPVKSVPEFSIRAEWVKPRGHHTR